jgi:hypothetical protein
LHSWFISQANTMLSRAKAALVVVGDHTGFSAAPATSILRRLADHAGA